MSSDPLDRIRESNRQAIDAWPRWAVHREHVTDVLTSVARDAGHLCLLGAGRLNDVHVEALRARHSRITLVDVDRDAVVSAIGGEPDPASWCRVRAPTDLTGILERLADAPAGGPCADELVAVLATHECAVPGGPFDVTASLGVLTQMLQSVVDAGFDAHDLARVSVALRDKHLRDLVHLTRPGGTSVLVTDVVSTATAPGLERIAPEDLEAQMASLVAARNFFTATNPYRIVALLEDAEPFRRLVTRVRIVGPWLWAVTTDRKHLTCAVVAERRVRAE